ncbi:IS110 family transposase [Paenibacillus thiaminolyticus]|uniref:IS110 family transposase n=1 Tax=Paenibacillus thiaminolyticus TaxID=49283 RepID=UPI00234FBA49|nr:transposase [Paenibacillus thiaminolyticus]WCR28352.1 IS110 family transposase [Paenibacillus thiaminolyticus]
MNFRGVQLDRTVSFSNNQFGYEKLLQWIHDIQQKHGLMQVIFGAESTGHYFLNLAFWLHQRNEQVVLVNPKTTKRNKENRDNKPSKNDAKDAIIIADTVSHGYYSEWVIHETLYRKLRCLVNERDALVTDLTAIGNQLQPALDQSFPNSPPMELSTWLQTFPSPSDLKDLTPEKVIDGWRKAGMQRAGGFRSRQQAIMLLAAAHRSVGLTDIAPEIKRQIGCLLQR